MDSEIIADLVGGLVEVGASSADNKKSGCGCLIFIAAFVLIIGIMYFTDEKETNNSPEIKKQNIIKQ